MRKRKSPARGPDAGGRGFNHKSTATEAQYARILIELRTGPRTSYDLRRIGCYQAPARIIELRRMGCAMNTTLASTSDLVHNLPTAETKAVGFDSSKVSRRTNRHQAVFFRPSTMRAFFGRAMVGASSDAPVSVDAGLSTPLSARPPHLTVGSGSNQTTEATVMAKTLARPVQSLFPYTTEQAIHAAKLWFAQRKPSMSIGAWRDHLLNIHLTALQATDWRERIERTQVWNEAFARGVAASIGGGHHA